MLHLRNINLVHAQKIWDVKIESVDHNFAKNLNISKSRTTSSE